MRVLVTGAGGFAGGYVARRLACLGADVLAVTRHSEVTVPSDKNAAGRFNVLRADLATSTSLPRTDFIVHAAATSIWSGITVDQMLIDNVQATRALVSQALRTEVKGFVYFSSLSTLGDISSSVVSEDTPSINPDVYGLTKLLGERLLTDVANQLPSLSIRLPAVIGPGSKRNWLSECVRKLKAGEPLSYLNPKAYFNNACHIEDLTQMIFKWLQHPKSGADMTMVGAAGRLMVKDIVEHLSASFDAGSEIQLGTRNLRTFLIDCSYARTNLGYTPMEVSAMLDRFIDENR